MARRIAPLTVNAGLEDITILASVKDDQTSQPRRVAIRFSYAPGAGIVANVTAPPTEPLRPLDEYAQKVQRSQARGLVYPYELIPTLTGSEGSFVEYDFDESGDFVPCRPSVWTQHCRPHRRHGVAADGPLPRGNDAHRLVR